MAYKAEGKIEKIFDAEQKSASFQAREFVIEVTEGQYPQMVKFQLVQDKCTLVDDFAEGDMVEVDFDLRGREWNGKYFTNLQAWRIGKVANDSASGDGTAHTAQSATVESKAASAPPAATTDFDDDIPF